MKVWYTGPFDAVVVPLPYGGEVEATRDGAVDVPDSLGARLLEQPDNWQAEDPSAPAAAPKASKKGGPAAEEV